VKFADIVEKKVEKVGSVDPVKDFQAMLMRRDEGGIVATAITQMLTVIKTLIQESFGDVQFPKAIQCLEALKDGCIKQEEVKAYNAGLKELKHAYSKKKPQLWKMICEYKGGSGMDLAPIDKKADGDSEFSQQQAKEFMTYAAEVNTNESSGAPLDDDDLFGSMD